MQAYVSSMRTMKKLKYCWYLDFFNIFGLLIVKIMFHSYFERKMTRFRYLTLFISLTLKQAPPWN